MKGFDLMAILLNKEFSTLLLHGLQTTLWIAIGSWLLAMTLALLLLTIRLTPSLIGLGLCQAAYFSEDLRSGLRSIPPGQAEAARALGHSYIGAMRHVLMPQAIRNAVPALVNHSVSLFKNSSLAMAIGAAELTHAVKEVESQSSWTPDASSRPPRPTHSSGVRSTPGRSAFYRNCVLTE